IVLLLVLGTGMVLGMALDRQLEARAVRGGQDWRPPAPQRTDSWRRGFDSRPRDSSRDPEESRDSIRRRPSLIVEQVGLSEEQEAQADSIFWLYRSRMRALHEEFDAAYSSRFEEIMAQSREDMLSILTAEQRLVYDSLLSEWDHRIEERRQDSISEQGGNGGEG
ncbi:MAG: hypothetical protein PVJ76_13870, partial [Gemmatimonadota bacterium]